MAWRFAAMPGIQLLEAGTRAKVDSAIAAAWRPVAIGSIAGAADLRDLQSAAQARADAGSFTSLFGIKMLLALHVFAVSLLATRADNPRRSRQLTGIVISGVVILIISAAFRWV